MKYLCYYLLWVAGLLLCFGCNSERPESQPPSAAPPETRDQGSSRSIQPDDNQNPHTILFLGNSITAGYGLDPEQAFPNLIQQRIDSLGWKFQVINAGLSGETSAGGLRRLDWLLQNPVDVLLIELGGNDGLRGIPPEVTRQNLEAIITKARERYPDVHIILAGMQIPPNLGPEYTQRFRDIFPAVARETNVELIPFILEGVGGVSSLNQPDGIHPTASGHRIVASVVWETLKPVLEKVRNEPS